MSIGRYTTNASYVRPTLQSRFQSVVVSMLHSSDNMKPVGQTARPLDVVIVGAMSIHKMRPWGPNVIERHAEMWPSTKHTGDQ